MSLNLIFSSSRCNAKWACSRPVILDKASQAFTATCPLVSGANINTTSVASISDSIFAKPDVDLPSPTVPFSSFKPATSSFVSQAIPLPPLPTFSIKGPSDVNRS